MADEEQEQEESGTGEPTEEGRESAEEVVEELKVQEGEMEEGSDSETE